MVGGAAAHTAVATEPGVTVTRNRTGQGDRPSTRQRPRWRAPRPGGRTGAGHPPGAGAGRRRRAGVSRRGLGDGDGRRPAGVGPAGAGAGGGWGGRLCLQRGGGAAGGVCCSVVRDIACWAARHICDAAQSWYGSAFAEVASELKS